MGACSNNGGKTWGEPIELINNRDRDDGDPSIMVDGNRLLVISTSIRLPDRFDKFNIFPVKYDRTWWWMTLTEDSGKAWSRPIEVSRPHLNSGKRTNVLRLRDNTLLLLYYYEIDSKMGQVPKLEGDMRVVL